MLEHLLAGGVHGLFVLGSTSEVVFHDDATRQRIIEHTVEVVRGRVPVLAGVIDPATDRVIGHARTAQAAGVDAVVVTAPFYTRTSGPEIVDHFRYVRDAVDLPVVAYDIPVCVQRQAGPRDRGDAGARGGDRRAEGQQRRRRQFPLRAARTSPTMPEFFLMTGSEIVVDSVLAMGAHGVVPGLAQRRSGRLCAPVGRGAARRLDGGARRAGTAVPAVRDRLARHAPHQSPARPASAASRPRCGAWASSTPTSWRARNGRSNEAEAARVETILRATGLLE